MVLGPPMPRPRRLRSLLAHRASHPALSGLPQWLDSSPGIGAAARFLRSENMEAIFGLQRHSKLCKRRGSRQRRRTDRDASSAPKYVLGIATAFLPPDRRGDPAYEKWPRTRQPRVWTRR